MIRKYYDVYIDEAGGSSNQGKKYPIGGYAPGNYTCHCCTCKTSFVGDKQAVQCKPCAEKMIAHQSCNQEQKEAIPPHELERIKHEAILLIKPDWMALRDPYRVLNYCISAASSEYLRAHKLKGTEPVLRWINCGKLFPDDWQEKIIRHSFTKKLITEEMVDEATGEYSSMEDGEDIYYHNCEWLCDSIPPSLPDGEVKDDKERLLTLSDFILGEVYPELPPDRIEALSEQYVKSFESTHPIKIKRQKAKYAALHLDYDKMIASVEGWEGKYHQAEVKIQELEDTLLKEMHMSTALNKDVLILVDQRTRLEKERDDYRKALEYITEVDDATMYEDVEHMRGRAKGILKKYPSA